MPAGFGTIEGGFRSVIRRRMKKGGTRWSLDGASNLMSLRHCRQNDRMTDMFEWRHAA